MIFLFPNEVTDISKILYICEVTSKLNKKKYKPFRHTWAVTEIFT